MKVNLTNGNQIRINITHITPEMQDDDISASVYRRDAFDYLKEVSNYVDDYNINGTVATIKVGDEELSKGYSILNTADTFSKHHGVCVALARALRNGEFSKQDRTIIWNEVFNGKYQKKGK